MVIFKKIKKVKHTVIVVITKKNRNKKAIKTVKYIFNLTRYL
jgi:hypothetical protein